MLEDDDDDFDLAELTEEIELDTAAVPAESEDDLDLSEEELVTVSEDE